MAVATKIILLCILLICITNTDGSKQQQHCTSDRCAIDYLILRSLDKMSSKINILRKKVDEYGKKQKDLVSSYEMLAASQKNCVAKMQEQNNKITGLSKKVDYTNGLVRSQGYGAGRWVFHVKSKSGHYKFYYKDAVAACKAKGAVLATKIQLEVAYKFGMGVCSCGWLTDKTVFYPTQWPTGHCGGLSNPPGLSGCDWQSTWDAYCFLPGYQGSTTVYY